jgi:hypothetical protein
LLPLLLRLPLDPDLAVAVGSQTALMGMQNCTLQSIIGSIHQTQMHMPTLTRLLSFATPLPKLFTKLAFEPALFIFPFFLKHVRIVSAWGSLATNLRRSKNINVVVGDFISVPLNKDEPFCVVQ